VCFTRMDDSAPTGGDDRVLLERADQHVPETSRRVLRMRSRWIR
jgi:hypothetical protein